MIYQWGPFAFSTGEIVTLVGLVIVIAAVYLAIKYLL